MCGKEAENFSFYRDYYEESQKSTEHKEYGNYWEYTLSLEKKGKVIKEYFNKYKLVEPPSKVLEEVKDYIVEIAKWKGMCIESRYKDAKRNNETEVWDSIKNSLNATDRKEKLLNIMVLKGFGSSVDIETGLRPAKVASAVLRFLDPEEWGVVDWRSAKIATLLKKHSFDIGKVKEIAKELKQSQLKSDLRVLNEDWILKINDIYKQALSDDLTRISDVDMAFFGISMFVWDL